MNHQSGCHRPIRSSTGHVPITFATSQFLLTCLNAKVGLTKGRWYTGKRTKIKAQQSYEIWVSKSLREEGAPFQISSLESVMISVGHPTKRTPHHIYNGTLTHSQVENILKQVTGLQSSMAYSWIDPERQSLEWELGSYDMALAYKIDQNGWVVNIPAHGQN